MLDSLYVLTSNANTLTRKTFEQHPPFLSKQVIHNKILFIQLFSVDPPTTTMDHNGQLVAWSLQIWLTRNVLKLEAQLEPQII